MAVGDGKVGELRVEVTADPTRLKQGLGQAQAATETAASRITASLSGIRSAMGKLFLPVAIFAGVTRLISLFDELRHQSEEFAKSLDSIRDGFSRPIDASVFAHRAGVDEFDVQRADLLRKAQETRRQLDAEAEKSLMGMGRLLRRNLFGGIFGDMSGDEIRRELAKQQRLISDSTEAGLKDIERMEDRARQEREAKEQEAREKKLKEEIEAHRKAMLEARENIHSVESAYRSLADAQRSAFDSQSFTLTIGRLAAYIEDLSKSLRYSRGVL